MDPTSHESFSGWWHAALETDGKAVTSICLYYAPWLYRVLHAREPQLVTCWAPQGPDDAYPNVEVRPKAEHIPSAAIFEAALVAPQVFEYDVTIRATGGPCAVAQTYLLMHAIERAVWNTIRGDRASIVAPSTSVSISVKQLSGRGVEGGAAPSGRAGGPPGASSPPAARARGRPT